MFNLISNSPLAIRVLPNYIIDIAPYVCISLPPYVSLPRPAASCCALGKAGRQPPGIDLQTTKT
jgi:hypothetical protein